MGNFTSYFKEIKKNYYEKNNNNSKFSLSSMLALIKITMQYLQI
jgi:hypothetical protein